MIEKVADIDELKQFDNSDLFFVRIMSLAKAYGCEYPFARFYRQIDDNDKITAIASSLDGDITLCVSDGYDKNELSDFFNMLGYSTLLCDSRFEMGSHFQEGAVMNSSKKFEVECEFTEIDEYPHLFDLYNFIDYPQNDFQSWYVDISHRIRHSCAKAVSLNRDGEIVSSAVLSSIYGNDAVITAVRTNPQYRGRGCGSALVSALCAEVTGMVYLMREENKNEAFYKRLGFENCGKWRIYK